MFTRLARLPLRRCLHTIPPRSSPSHNRLRFTLGASVVAATYLTWHLTSDSKRISLDSVTNLQSTTTSSISPKSSSQTTLPTSEKATLSGRSPEDPKVMSASEPGSEGTEAAADAPKADAEDQEASGGAYNPVTGEINWDCPCLGGMAHGPCGPEFREAFSCFVFSEAEPKGINCVEKFQAMQNCFRAHPETYGDEIMDDDEDDQRTPTEKGAIFTSSTTTEDGSGVLSAEAAESDSSGGSSPTSTSS